MKTAFQLFAKERGSIGQRTLNIGKSTTQKKSLFARLNKRFTDIAGIGFLVWRQGVSQ
jgi:hypothetical protein